MLPLESNRVDRPSMNHSRIIAINMRERRVDFLVLVGQLQIQKHLAPSTEICPFTIMKQ